MPETLIPTVAQRGTAVLNARGVSSAASVANAAIDHMRDWLHGSNGRWVSMGIERKLWGPQSSDLRCACDLHRHWLSPRGGIADR